MCCVAEQQGLQKVAQPALTTSLLAGGALSKGGQVGTTSNLGRGCGVLAAQAVEPLAAAGRHKQHAVAQLSQKHCIIPHLEASHQEYDAAAGRETVLPQVMLCMLGGWYTQKKHGAVVASDGGTTCSSSPHLSVQVLSATV